MLLRYTGTREYIVNIHQHRLEDVEQAYTISVSSDFKLEAAGVFDLFPLNSASAIPTLNTITSRMKLG